MVFLGVVWKTAQEYIDYINKNTLITLTNELRN